MEIRAPYILVGLVTVTVFLALAVFAVWVTDATLGAERDRYAIYFEDPISGLDVDSPVRFNGIRVGRVVETRIDRDTPTRIRVTIDVAADTPVREGAHALVLPQGITGTSYVQIRSGSDPGPPIVAEAGEPLPIIPSESSPLQRVLGGAPDLLTHSTLLVERLAKLFDEENRDALTQTLARIEEITRDLADQTGNLEGAGAELAAMREEARASMRSIDAAAQSARVWLEEDLTPLSRQTLASLEEAQELIRHLDQNLNRQLAPQIADLTGNLARMVERAGSLVDAIETSPAGFLAGGEGQREVELR